MSKHMNPRQRGLVAVRAETPSDMKAAIEAVNRGFEAFKAEHTKQLDDLKKGKADVVLDEKVERINASVGELQTNVQKAIDDMSVKIAAAGLAEGVIGDLPANPEYVSAFKAHMRKGEVQASMSIGTAVDGGYLAPVEWDRTITSKLKETSPIRANAKVQSITGPAFSKLFTDRAVGSGWVGETATRPATSTPQFGPLPFSIGEIYAFPQITQTLLDDAAINLEDWLAGEVDGEFGRQENIAFLAGDGVNKPHGILTYVEGGANAARHPWGAIKVVSTGSAGKLTADSFVDLFYSVPTGLRTGAKLFTNRLSQGAMRKLKDGQGNYLWQPTMAAGQPATLAGESIVEVPDMPDVAAGNIAALYGNMEETYLVIDRVGIRVLRDALTNKPYVGFYTTKRVGGGVQNPEPMRALKVA
ncbi:phage major capsid protein [Tianweitania sp.]|uniref:phage major capsid protein n=1 Tax=Tianweitania sp. TaxID=2021634 RepID=UPI00289B13DA|nr:phage major capsid protein [Tianweitania sp.]